MHTTTVADNIRAEMARRRVRQRDLADRIGVNQQAMSNRLCGITPLSAREIQIIADTLGCHAETLTGGQHA